MPLDMPCPVVLHLSVDFPIDFTPEKNGIFSRKDSRLNPEKILYMSLLNPLSDFWTEQVEVLRVKYSPEELARFEQIALARFSRRKSVPHIGLVSKPTSLKLCGQNISISNSPISKSNSNVGEKLSKSEMKALVKSRLDEKKGK